MYSLFLVLGVALVILSPLALELWLTTIEQRAPRRRAKRVTKVKSPGFNWASSRLHP